MTSDFLSEQARRLADYVAETGIDVDELIDAYDRWESAGATAPADSSAATPAGSMLAGIRRRFGLVTGAAAEFEAFGDVIRAQLAGRNDETNARWHEAKLGAVGGNDRDKKLLALRHLDAGDFDDELMVAALVESLSRDDETLATTFAATAGALIDPDSHTEIVKLLLAELKAYEQRRLSRAALFGACIWQIYENHAVPPDWLIAEWAAIVTGSDDPASFAALVDLGALVVERLGDDALIRRWLSSGRMGESMLAIGVVRRLGLQSVDAPLRRSIVDALSAAQARLASAPRSSDANAEWLRSAIAEALE